MWIVRIALDRPYTFIVLALLILILSPLVILRTPTDIFPNINIPVIAVVWTYTGLNPEEMEGRLTIVLRAVADHAGRQHPAHRIRRPITASAAGQDLPAAGRQPRYRQRAGDGRLADDAAADAARHAAAGDPQLQRVERADPAARPVRPRPVRAAAQRSRLEFPAHPAGDRAGRGRSLSLWRQAAPGDDHVSNPQLLQAKGCRRPTC